MHSQTVCEFIADYLSFLRSNPDTERIVDTVGTRTVTSGQFVRMVDSISHSLDIKGIGVGDVVVIRLEKKAEQFAAIFSCISNGHVYVVVNPDYPEERVSKIHAACSPSITIDDDFISGALSLEDVPEVIPKGLSDSEPCMIYFTSGTTGEPKGILHSRALVTRMSDALIKNVPSDGGDNVISLSDSMFVLSMGEWVLATCLRKKLHLLELTSVKDFTLLKKYIIVNSIGYSCMNPTLLRIIGTGTPLSVVFVAGEKPGTFSGFKSIRIFNLFGSTECPIMAFGSIKDTDTEATINMQVMDDELLLSDGDRGEILIRTRRTMIRYLGMDGTDGKYVDESDSEFSIFHSGDFGKRVDGGIVAIGRMDSMVKINGQRVEPAESEYVMSRIPGVDEAVVKAFEEDGRTYLCGYYTSKIERSELEVRDALNRYLPNYMVPAFISRVDEFPRNQRGKVDRKSLRTLRVRTASSVLPENDIQRMICGAFSEALGISNVGIEDDFIALGGDSLKAMKVQSLLGGRVSSSTIIRYRTPKVISEFYHSFDVELLSFDGAHYFNDSQLGVYLDIVKGKDGTEYNNPFSIPLAKDVDIDRLRMAIKSVVDAHPVLKGRIQRGNLPMMVYDSNVDVIVGGTSEGFVRPFDVYDCLSRFLIVDGRLFVDIHHLVFDGTSVNVLLNDISSAYFGKPLAMDKGILYPKPIAEHNAYYGEVFSDGDNDTGLVSVGGDECGSFHRTLSVTKEDMSFMMREYGVTVGTILTSAFGYAISRFNGRSDASFCILNDGRGYGDLYDSIGMFVRTIPIKVDCTDSSVRDFLSRTNDGINLAISDTTSFSDLARRYDLSTEVLFQYSHNIGSVDGGIYDGDGIEYLFRTSSSPIGVFVFDDGDGYRLSMEFTERYDEGFLLRLVDTFDRILESMSLGSDDGFRLSDIVYTSKEDMELQDSYNDTGCEIQHDNVLEAFRESVSKHPDSVLVSYLDRQYTYSESDVITDRIAYALQQSGVNKGDNVAILVSRSEWYLLAALGVLKAGAAYVPIDDTYPDERVSFMISDSSSKAVVCDSNTGGRIDPDMVSLEIDSLGQYADRTPFDVEVDGNDVCVILYTSGTTGKPKGTSISHLNVMNFSECFVRDYSLNSEDVFPLYCSFGFDAHMEVLFPTIIAGARVDVVPENVRMDIALLSEHVNGAGATILDLPTALGKVFIESNPGLRIRHLILGGESLGEFDTDTSYVLHDSYGPTETTVFVSHVPVRERISPSSVGYLTSNTRAYILDREHRRVPYGAIGELYIAGYQVSKGYLNNPELSNGAFIHNPFTSDEGYGTLYATGDFFRYLPDGTLGVLGRRDGQVKVRGNRVELTEVESVIRSMPEIGDVTVQPIVNDRGGKELCAYIVSDIELSSRSVMAYVSERRPQYMVPAFVIQLDSIPLNVNGKVDRRALPIPDTKSLHAEYVAPRNDDERILCEAFSKALNIETIGIDDDFIRLGGDSLKAIRVQNLANLSTTADILRYRTVRDIVEHILIGQYDLDMYTLESGCPLSESQLNVYLDIEAHAKEGSYFIPFMYSLPEHVSTGETRALVQRLIAAYPILSSRVSINNGVPWLYCDSKPVILDRKLALDDLPDVSECVSVFGIHDHRIEAIVSHMAFDGFSSVALTEAITRLIDGKDLLVDTGFLRASSFDSSIKDTQRYSEAHEFYDSLLCETDNGNPLIDDVGGSSGVISKELSSNPSCFHDIIGPFGISTGAFLTSVFAYTLSRFTGRSDAIFTIAENGRELPGLEDSVGMFTRTLPIWVDCSDSDIKDFVRKASESIYGSMSAGIYPFREISKQYDVSSDIIFQYLVDLKSASATGVSFKSNDEALLKDSDAYSGISPNTEISVSVIEASGRLYIRILHSDRYSKDTMGRLVSVFDVVLASVLSAMSDDPSSGITRLSDIEYTSKEDIALQDSYNDSEREIQHDNVLEAFKESVSQHPDSILVSYLDRQYTYSESDVMSDNIAIELIRNGISKGDHVAMLVPRSEWYMLVPISVLKAGCAYVPLDDTYPDERLSYMVSDSSAKAIVCTSETKERAISFGSDAIVIDIDTIADIGTRKDDSHYTPLSNIDIDREDSTIILYTSGTTGKPKGAVLCHRNLINHSEWIVDAYDVTDKDRFVYFSSCGFDVHLETTWSPLVVGASVDVLPEDIRFDIDAIARFVEDRGSTFLHFPAAMGRLFTERHHDSNLRIMVVGGEKLGPIPQTPNYRLYDKYGPTECSVSLLNTLVSDKIEVSSVGYPIGNMRAYVLDREHRRVPFGAVGELFVAGYQVSKGYLNNRELSDRTFVHNPFTSDEGYGTLYATGDFFRYLPDGSLGILGRRDGQVKVRGNRVELTEVESVIRSIPGIDDVTVQPIVNESGGKELCAYVVADDSIVGTADMFELVTSYVSERKPQYMVPAFVIVLDRIPLNVNGKVNKRILPKPDSSSLHAEYVAPRNDNERKLCEALSQTLNIEPIGIDDDFIRLGGDSLKAIKVQNIAKMASTADILRYRTVREIVKHLQTYEFDLDLYTLDTGCPLSESQLNVYLDIEANAKQGTYMIPFMYELPEQVSTKELLAIVRKLLVAFPILSTRISVRDGTPWMFCDSEPDVLDRELTIDDSPDVSKCVSVFGIHDHTIEAIISHMAFDGFSSVVLMDAISAIVEDKDLPVDTGFLRSSSHDTSVKGTEHYAQAYGFYDSLLCDGDNGNPLMDDVNGYPGTVSRALSNGISEINGVIGPLGVSAGAFLTSIFGYSLSRFTGRSDAVFTIAENGRELPGLESSIGMFVRTLPVRMDCSDVVIRDFIKNASESIYGSMSAGIYPFRELSKQYDVTSDIVFQYMAGMEALIETRARNYEGTKHRLADAYVLEDKSHISELSISIRELSGSLHIFIDHSARYSSDTMQRLADVYDAVLSFIITHLSDGSRLSDIIYTSSEDIELQDSYNGVERGLQYHDILDAFRGSVSRGPDSTLVTYLDRSYSYAESDTISDNIAFALQQSGVNKGDNVVIFVPRSEWYLLSALGVLKTGAAFVPIDDSYPDERISFMVTDSSSRVALCTSETKGRLRALFPEISIVDPNEIQSKPSDASIPIPEIADRDVAMVLYTSGTTGQPKGTLITHLAVITHSEWYVRNYGMTSNDVHSMHVPFVFDAHNDVLYPTIVCGASVDIIPEDVRMDMVRLNEHFMSRNVTHAFFTSNLGKLFLQSVKETSVTTLVVGGEKLGSVSVPSGLRMFDEYGPTETVACVTSIDVTERMDDSSVGHIIDNTKVYILDREHRRVPFGAVGELYISGYKVSNGYLNRPDLSEKVFLDNPFCSDPRSDRMYATGDFFRYLPDGTLGIIGRRDGQVKVRGNRVELTEVEATIRSMPGILNVTVQPIVNENGGKELCAYIVSDIELSSDSVISYVSERKPQYMVPSFVVHLDTIPLNVNGKVDVRALPKPDSSSLHAEYVAPRNDNERRLCEALSQTLNIESIGIDDDFIRLGGDSLKAIRFVSICRSSGISVQVKDVLEKRTVRSMASSISGVEDMGSYVGGISLSPIQGRFLSRGTQRKRDHYNQSMLLKVLEPMSLETLQKALDSVTDHHDMLRAVYGEEPYVREPGTSVCTATEFGAQSKDEMTSHMDSLQTSLSLSDGRLMAVSLMTLNDDGPVTQYLFITIHHMVVDGVSWSIILDDLTSAYRSISEGRAVTLPPRTLPFQRWLDVCSQFVPSDRERAYWEVISESIANIGRTLGETVPFSVSSDVSLSGLSDNIYGFDTIDILLTAFAQAYSGITGEDSLTIRMEGHGRQLADVSRTVGWFTDVYPLRLTVSGNIIQDLFSVRKAIRDVPRGGIGYSLAGYDRLPGITFNYLSTAFAYDNGLLRAVDDIPTGRNMSDLPSDDSMAINIVDSVDGHIVNGHHDGSIVFDGVLKAFEERIQDISTYLDSNDVLETPLSESQLNVYLDEMKNDLCTQYNAPGLFNVPDGKGVEDCRAIIGRLIDAHPILRARIVERDGVPWMVADSEPEVSVGSYDDFIRPFDLKECLSRFRIVDSGRLMILFDMHHSIMDATSRGILLRDLHALFDGSEIDMELGYFGISSAEASATSYDERTAAEEFFEGMFCDIDTDSGLIPDVGDHDYGNVSLDLRVGKVESSSIADRFNITKGALFASVFAYMLSRFTGRSDSVFTFTDSGRDVPGSENAVGMFVRTFGIDIDCSDTTVGEFLSKASDRYLNTMVHGRAYPFRELARAYDINISVSYEYNRDINESISKEYVGLESILGGELSDTRRSETGIVADIVFVVDDTAKGHSISISHSGRFSDDTVKRMGQVYDAILSAISESVKNGKDIRLSDIDYTSLQDIELQDSFNRTEHELQYRNILEAFDASVSQCPDSILVSYLDRQYTYSESDVISDDIASALQQIGVNKGDNVAILVPRSEWYLLAALGVLKTGAVYVPIDDSYPDERISFMISDSSSKSVVCTSETKDRATSFGFPIIVIEDVISHPSERAPSSVPIDYDDVCVILYTSGTTGLPKGSRITHRALENMCEWYHRYTEWTSDDKYGLYTSYSFDICTLALFAPILPGCSVDIVPEDVRYDLDRLNDHFVSRKVTHSFITTQLGKTFALSGFDTTIRFLTYGGEKMGEFTPPDDIGACETYGPSESLALITAIPVNDRSHHSSVGHLLDNIKVYILDKEHRRVPYGAIGELYISGYQLSTGYLNRDGLNAQSFFNNPFSSEPGFERIYATGDFFRYLPDGTLGVLGRRDGQVKIRGNRVELTEVEAAIRSITGIDDVTVQPIVNDNGGKELCAYVVLDESTIDASDVYETVTSYVSERKPQYMVPAFIIVLDRIPLNINGKVDRRALPRPDSSSLRAEYISPRNDNERRLCEAFSQTLNIETIGIDDDFIKLGGDSLKAIKVQNISKLSTTADILRYRTVREIVRHLHINEFDPDLYSLDTGCPLSESQLNVYLDIKANAKQGTYMIPFQYDLPESVSEKEAKEVVSKLLNAFPILSSRIVVKEGIPWMYCDSKPTIHERPLTFNDSPEVSKCVSVFAVHDRSIEAIISHMAFDGFSSVVLTNAISQIVEGKDVPVDTGFLRSSSYDSSIKGTERYAEAHAYYDSLLCDGDNSNPLVDDIDGSSGTVSMELSKDISEIDEIIRPMGISAGAFLTSIFGYTLSRFSGRSDAVFTIAENGRELPGLENSIGMFVRTLPIRIDCSDTTVRGFIRDASESIYDSISAGIYPFRELSKQYDVTSDIIFQYMAGVEDLLDYGADISRNDYDRGSEHGKDDQVAHISDLSVFVREFSGRLHILIDHSARYSDATMQRFADVYDRVLSSILSYLSDSESGTRLSDIVYTSHEDIELQDSYNDTDHDLQYHNILDAFRATASEYADSTLVSYLDESYTYAESDIISDRIAYVLQQNGVNKGDNVAILVSRSEWYLLAALGVLKAGAAYVPMDDTYPDERISFMVSDSCAKAILCTPDTKVRVLSVLPDAVVVDLQGIPELTPCPSVVKISPDDAAVILYTSGTTGTPKGMSITHLGIENMCESYISITGMDHEDVQGLYAPSVFDPSLTAMFTAIVCGASVDIVPEDVRHDIALLNAHFNDKGVTHTQITAQLGRLFATVVDDTSIEYLSVGGEMLGDVDPSSQLVLIDSYGPAELTAFTNCIRVSDKVHTSSLGNVNFNTRAYILDPEHRRVPCGAVGELYVSGYQMSKGYLNNPELTDMAFIRNPFSRDEGHEVLYATGDYFRYLPDGTLGIIGRRDGQVKVRGNRVELSEVETTVRSIPGIDDVTVQPIVNDNGGKELCAYVVIDESTIDVSEIYDIVTSYVSERKPQYMVPAFVVRIDAVPLNVNGKVDRRALPEPDTTLLRAEYVEPRNINEMRLCDAFSEALGLEGHHLIGIDDDFIKLGGDSLKAIKVQNISKLSTTADILRYRTVREIVKHLRNDQFDPDLYTLETGCPLSESQLNVYLDIEANAKQGTYMIPFQYDLPEDLPEDNIRDIVRRLLETFPILSSRIAVKDGTPWLYCDSEPLIHDRPLTVDDSPNVSDHVSVLGVHGHRIEAIISHMVFDGFSNVVLSKAISDLVKGMGLSVDVGFLRSSSHDVSLKGTERYADARIFYDSILSGNDNGNVLMDDVDGTSGSVSKHLSVDPSEVHDVAKILGTSVGTFLTSVFGYTLSRFTGSSDAIFTIAENGRELPGLENSIGMFVRTLPVRIDCSDDTVERFVEMASESIYGSMLAGIYPFREISKEYGVTSDIIFQYMAGMEAVIDDYNTVPSFERRDVRDTDRSGSHISDLSVYVREMPGDLSFNINHSGRYSDATAQRIADVYDAVLSAIVKRSEKKITMLSDIEYTSSDDIELQDSYNDTKLDLQYGNILEAFDGSVSRYPDSLLVSCSDRRYTYSESDTISDNIAFTLQQCGVNKGDNVAILVPRSEWYLLAALGVLKIGAAYVPIDDAYPDERISFMISDSSAKVIICTSETKERVSSLDDSSTIVVIDDIDLRSKDNRLNDVRVEKDDTFTILYTSGTTGTPKGTLVSHLNVINYSEWYVRRFRMESKDRYAMQCAYVFDAHLMALYPVMVCGASVDIITKDIRLDMDAMRDRFLSEGVTHTFKTTQLGRAYVSSVDDPVVKVLLVGGEALGEIDPPKNMEFVDIYGPTETVVSVSVMDVRKRTSVSSVGHVNGNVKVYILDDEGRRVPYGAVGELYIAGYQVSKGYLNDDDLTKASFKRNPFSSEPGYERIYATGDFFRYLPDGSLGIIGRRDGQLKIRGNRVELTEVESVIRSIHGIDDVTVQPVVNGSGGKELCAYVVVNTSTIDTSDVYETVTSYVSERKPQYMVPAFVIVLDRVPLNINGKVDRRALPIPDTGSLRSEYIAPRNDNERKLCEAFSQTLNIGSIGIDDDFIRLGGDSLKAIKVHNIVRISSTADILRYRTVREIVRHTSTTDYDPGLYTWETGCPLSDSQMNYYYRASKDPSIGQTIGFRLLLKGINDLHEAKGLLDSLVKAYPILRSRLIIRDGAPWMVLDDEPFIRILDPNDPDAVSSITSRFDLASDVLCRFGIQRREGGIWILVNAHNVIMDGVSIIPLLTALTAPSSLNDKEPDMSPLMMSSHDMSIREAGHCKESERVMRSIIESSSVGYLPSGTSDRISERIIRFTDVFDGMNEYMQKAGVTITGFFSAIVSKVLHDMTGRDRCLFFITNDGRDVLSDRMAFGRYAKGVPFSIDSDFRDMGSVMRQASDSIMTQFSLDQYPLWMLLKEYGIDWDVRIQYDHFLDGIGNDDGMTIEQLDTGYTDSMCDLMVSIVKRSGEYSVRLVTSKACDPSFVEEFGSRLDVEVRGAIGP